jgi:hypothetical protein
LIRTAFIILVAIVYLMMTLNTTDPLWFWTAFEETPSTVKLYCYGDVKTLAPDSQEFSELTAVFNENFSGYKNWDSLTLSEESWADYQVNDQFATLVLEYPAPVRVHSIYKYFSNVDRLIVPLDGRHSQSLAVFGMNGDVPGSGAMHIRTLTPLIDYVSDSGICNISP